MEDIKKVLDSLLDEAKLFSKEQLIDLILEGKSDTNDLIKKMGDMTEKFLKQRTLGEITNSEFKELMEDVLELNEMQYNKLAAEAKVKADRLRDGLQDLVVNKLLALI